jgi:hypothetical protein
MLSPKIKADLKSAGLTIYHESKRIAKNTIKRETKRARKVQKMTYPKNLGIYHKDVNHLTNF